jgi:gluconate 2-dehydrogenase gamma chain
MADHENLSRRELIQLTAAAAVAGATASSVLASEPAPKFFSKDEFAMVDELSELIIPADEHSPGARAAQVAAYIDGRLAESFEEEPKRRWHEGLARINSLSQEIHGEPFMQVTLEQREALLTRIAKHEEKPETPEEHFFRELKARTARAYYTSKIGIHQEMEYKGNVLLQEFVGYEVK